MSAVPVRGWLAALILIILTPPVAAQTVPTSTAETILILQLDSAETTERFSLIEAAAAEPPLSRPALFHWLYSFEPEYLGRQLTGIYLGTYRERSDAEFAELIEQNGFAVETLIEDYPRIDDVHLKVQLIVAAQYLEYPDHWLGLIVESWRASGGCSPREAEMMAATAERLSPARRRGLQYTASILYNSISGDRTVAAFRRLLDLDTE